MGGCLLRILAVLLLIVWSATALAEQVQVGSVRMWQAPEHTRLVFDVSAPVEHTIFRLPDPERLVIDMRNARLVQAANDLSLENPFLKRMRSAPRNGSDLRVVLDLKRQLRPKSFLLKPNQEYGHRLVIDLYDPGAEQSAAEEPGGALADAPQRPRDVVIAIDAGHGGEDPGARGRGGTREKDVVLQIARRLADLVRKEKGMQPVLIRDGDYYLGLRKRMEKARAQKADLLISIHADAFRDARAKGASVYVLSRSGATSEAARWLAESENASDLVGGVSLDDKDDLLAKVLLDLSQTGTIEASLDAGSDVLTSLKQVVKAHKQRVQQAGFVVLKSPDIPSILVETAFISNPREERKLRDPRHQQRMAKAMMGGIRNYFVRHAPPGTLLAERREHVIARGDTLSEIAEQYQISLASLRAANEIEGDQLEVGQVLRIPGAEDS